LTDAELKRLWQHGLNEEKNYNDRLTFFLVFNSFLMAGVLNLFRAASKDSPPPPYDLIRWVGSAGEVDPIFETTIGHF
jgi:hypothetical protein